MTHRNETDDTDFSRAKLDSSRSSLFGDWFGGKKGKATELVEVTRTKVKHQFMDGPTTPFETLEYPPKRPHQLDVHLSQRRAPVTRREFNKLFDADGRLVDEHKLRQEVFRGGVDPAIRKDVWSFLFGLYPFHSTASEREILQNDHYAKYKAMKSRWKKMLRSDEDGKRLVRVKYNLHPSDAEEMSRAGADVPSPVELRAPPSFRCPSLEVEQRMTCLDIQAQIAAERLPTDLEVLKKAIRVIDKDVPRTDRELDYFRGDDNKHLCVLRDILATFAAFHPEVNYAQGMNDLVSRFLVVLDDEVAAYWCFSRYLESIERHFTEEGLLDKLYTVKKLLTELDFDLWSYLESLGVGDMSFCHRWMILSFKREFEWADSLRLFEILSSHHLELSSMEAERIRDRERRKDFQNMRGKIRTADVVLNTDFTFDVFMCVSLLIKHRDVLFRCQEAAAVLQFTCGLAKKINLEELLKESETLFAQYCSKAVTDCFLVITPERPTNGGMSLPIP